MFSESICLKGSEGSKIKHATSTQRFLAWPSTAIPLFDSDFLGVYFIVSPEKKTWLRSLKSFSWSSIDNSIHLTRICSIHTDIQGDAFIHCSWTSFSLKNHFT